jgi:hypothetical protein
VHRTDLLDRSMEWMDALWDDDASLLWQVKRDRHMVRESANYALGLLERAAPGDVERAVRALRAVVAHQFPLDRAPYEGTFRRWPEEDDPPTDPLMWIHYDPNWRQFIGCTFAVVCDRHGDTLGTQVTDELRRSIELAVEGEGTTRVAPTYANIALMKAWLDAWAGRTDSAESLANAIYEHFSKNDAFLEYNSPTYYGIDLWALALWRSSTPVLQELGAKMERALWEDVARFYHAGLRNMCGPYDRAYGMDMTAHATPLGLWIWSVVGSELAPFPDPATRFRHPHDFCFGPWVTLFEPNVPTDVVADLSTFRGERLVERSISDDPRRVATAWLSDDVMVGAQDGPPSGIGFFQHHHATIHWRSEDGGVGWVRLLPEVPASARAEAGGIVITSETTFPVTLEVHPSPVVVAGGFEADGRRFSLQTNASSPVPEGARLVFGPAPGRTELRIGV